MTVRTFEGLSSLLRQAAYKEGRSYNQLHELMLIEGLAKRGYSFEVPKKIDVPQGQIRKPKNTQQ